MTPEQVAAWAKEAGLAYQEGAGLFASWQDDQNIAPYITRFAALVAAHERERCALIADERTDNYYKGPMDIATAIRAQGREPCGACNGSGWVVRDPDIGTDQECFVCNGSGQSSDAI